MTFLPVPVRLLLLLGLCAIIPASAATYYVDPAKGRIDNPGTSSKPWNTLEAVFAARKKFAAGDVILLRSGFHGAPVIKGRNSRDVTIRPDSGQKPTLALLDFKDASHWVVSGLDICPLHAGPKKFTNSRVVYMYPGSSHLTLKDCRIRSAFSISGWKESDWKTKVGGAVAVRAPHSTVTGNQIENVANGIFVFAEGHNSVISYNVIDSVRDDGFRGNANDCRFEYNTLKNMYAIDGNHDDAFQSFTQGKGGVGSGVIRNVVLRGNVFISYTDPKQPYKAVMQGIACFDGMYENWVIENNVIMTETWQGLTLMGAKNCRIVNNTVIKNPISARSPSPWIRVTPHKNGKRSSGNIVRNNITSSLSANSSIGTVDRNLVTTDYLNVFVDWKKFDLRLRASSPAINAGSSQHAPTHDADLRKRSNPVDLGAYEHGGKVSTIVNESKSPTPVAENPKPPKSSGGDKNAADKSNGSKAKGSKVTFETERLARHVRGGAASVSGESGASAGKLVYFGPKRKGDYIEFTTGKLPAGKYTLKIRVKHGKNRGRATVAVGGKTVGRTLDLHASHKNYREITVGTVTVKSGGAQKVRLVSAGKSGGAKGILLTPDRITFVAL